MSEERFRAIVCRGSFHHCANAFEVCGRVHGQALLFGDHRVDPVAVFQDPELFELLRVLQRCRLQ